MNIKLNKNGQIVQVTEIENVVDSSQIKVRIEDLKSTMLGFENQIKELEATLVKVQDLEKSNSGKK
jgi:hypothetical protein